MLEDLLLSVGVKQKHNKPPLLPARGGKLPGLMTNIRKLQTVLVITATSAGISYQNFVISLVEHYVRAKVHI